MYPRVLSHASGGLSSGEDYTDRGVVCIPWVLVPQLKIGESVGVVMMLEPLAEWVSVAEGGRKWIQLVVTILGVRLVLLLLLEVETAIPAGVTKSCLQDDG